MFWLFTAWIICSKWFSKFLQNFCFQSRISKSFSRSVKHFFSQSVSQQFKKQNNIFFFSIFHRGSKIWRCCQLQSFRRRSWWKIFRHWWWSSKYSKVSIIRPGCSRLLGFWKKDSTGHLIETFSKNPDQDV